MTLVTRPVPSTGEPLPVIGLGTWRTFDVGGSPSELAALDDCITTFADLGGRVIDSSPMYGGAERVVGELTSARGLRARLFIATKVWTSGRQRGIDQMRESMRRLRVSEVDLMQVHNLVDASIFREWVVNVGRRDSRARIAHLLCELVVRMKKIGLGDGKTFDFPLTQEQLADATGLTAVHTNRTLQSLRKDGLIQLSARSLSVLDWERLREVADFEDLYLHQNL